MRNKVAEITHSLKNSIHILKAFILTVSFSFVFSGTTWSSPTRDQHFDKDGKIDKETSATWTP